MSTPTSDGRVKELLEEIVARTFGSDVIRRMALEALRVLQDPHCPHGIDLDCARCGVCGEGERGAHSSPMADVAAERERQKAVEGWTPEHDDQHTGGQLAKAAACYAQCAGIGIATAAGLETHYEFVAEYSRAGCPSPLWPWAAMWWKPRTPRRDLVRAAALIVAEIERLDRETQRGD